MKKIFLVALVIRLICLYLFRNVINYDLQSYLQIGELTLKDINIYPTVAKLHYPYLPFFLYIEALATWLGRSKAIIIIIIKIINIIFDLANLWLVYLLSKKNLKTTFLYAVNPVTILISTLHGQFDVIPIFFILLAVYLLKKKKEFFSILSFSFAILTKTWPVLFFIPLIKRVKNKKLLLLIFIFPIIFTLYYSFKFKTPLKDIILTVFSYQGLFGIWGLTKIFFFPLRIRFQKLITLIFLTIFIFYSLKQNKKSILKEILFLLLFFYSFTANFSIQYLSWVAPFLIIIKPKSWLILIFLITIYLLSFYSFWLFYPAAKIAPKYLIFFQELSSFVLWFSFIKSWYLSRKKC